MSAPGFPPCGDCTSCGGCDRIAVGMGRAAFEAARRQCLLALQDAITLGVPLDELAHECEATGRAMLHLVALAEGGAP